MAGRAVGVAAIAVAIAALVLQFGVAARSVVTVKRAVAFDVSPPLASLRGVEIAAERVECDNPDGGCGTSPEGGNEQEQRAPASTPVPVNAASAAVEQTTQGSRPPAKLIVSFDGLGAGFTGPQGAAVTRNPSDNSIAVGPNHIVETVNSRMAVYTKTGKVLYGAVVTNAIFQGFGGPCETSVSGDAVVRYDQLAERWLYVLPIFRRVANRPKEPYSMCYAVSTGADPLGPYYRYEFRRKLFPDYPRPAVWPDGYYVPTSTGDNVIQKHVCIADRAKMLEGQPATEQCIVIDGVNFLNNADIDGKGLPPAGAPNIMMAAGGTQLKKIFEDDGIYAYQVHVDWETPKNTKVTGPVKIAVAPYHYLCDGQLTNCVPQPGTTRRLDAQGDKIMQRLVYRNLGGRESIVALHSINTAAGGGGVRWYEFRLNANRDPHLHQQGTYAPDGLYRWMGSMGMDRAGNIGIGYSFGGGPHFAGQRFAARLADDPPGVLTFAETILAEGKAAQTTTLRWEDYSTLAMDPIDDCTFWYVGDYLKEGATSYTTRIGAFRLPGCLKSTLSGRSYFDLDHDGERDAGEPGLVGREIEYRGAESGRVTTGASGDFRAEVGADPAYIEPAYTIAERPQSGAGWVRTSRESYSVRLTDPSGASGLDFGSVCTTPSSGGADLRVWSGRSGAAILSSHDPAWRASVNSTLHLVNENGSRFSVPVTGGQAVGAFQKWLRERDGRNVSRAVSVQLAMLALSVAFNGQDGKATVQDPVAGDWPTISALVKRVNEWLAEHPNAGGSAADRSVAEKYRTSIEKLNRNAAVATPSSPDKCSK